MRIKKLSILFVQVSDGDFHGSKGEKERKKERKRERERERERERTPAATRGPVRRAFAC